MRIKIIIVFLYRYIRSISQRIRRLFYTSITKLRVFKYGENLKVNKRSFLSTHTIIGNNCNFNGMFVKGEGSLIIGNNFHSGEDILVITSYHNYEGSMIPYDRTKVLKKIVIEDNVWIGHRVIIMGNIRIGEGAIIGAGCVVTKDIPNCAIVGGNPVRILKYRNIKNYETLVSQGRFH